MLLLLHYVFPIFFMLCHSETLDTIRQGQNFTFHDKLISDNLNFVLYFCPSGIKSYYLCISPINSALDTVIWRANTENPLKDYSSVLTIRSDGNLALVDRRGITMWSTFISKPGFMPINVSATILNSGNLVLQDYSGITLWQSFDFPTDTLIPGMRIWLDVRNGINTKLKSWNHLREIGTRTFSFGIDPQYKKQLVLWYDTIKVARIGLWNGRTFEGIEKCGDSVFSFSFISNPEEISLSYYTYDTSIFSRLVLDGDGQMKLFIWNDQIKVWDLHWCPQSDSCSFYNACSENSFCSTTNDAQCKCLKGFEREVMVGNQTNYDSYRRCERLKQLECRWDDEFEKMSNMKLPDYYVLQPALSSDVECENECRRNCSCTAYAMVSTLGGRNDCLIWNGDLVDLTQYLRYGDNLYVRLVASQKDSHDHNEQNLVISIGTILTGLVLVGSCVWCLWWFKIKKGRKMKSSDLLIHRGSQSQLIGKIGDGSKGGVQLPLYSFDTIAKATENFSSVNKLGEGGFGIVYKGQLNEGKDIAIKRLSRCSGQGVRELVNEVVLISKLQHRNLVRLLGCCIEEEEKILIYEYMPNKSLDLWLFNKDNFLDWPKRIQIIQGIAHGLLYLHHDSRLRIIHRDLKASNILLDDELNPKISDFGIARIFGGNQFEANTNRVVGTYGYMSPEYCMMGQFSVKSDVFSFGVLLLEILSGKQNDGPFDLLGHAWKRWNEGFGSEFADPKLQGSYPTLQFLRYFHAGLLCVQERAEDRPSIPLILIMLGGGANLPAPKEPSFFSNIIFHLHDQENAGARNFHEKPEQEVCSHNEISV